jgi:hypothetical protein
MAAASFPEDGLVCQNHQAMASQWLEMEKSTNVVSVMSHGQLAHAKA